MTEFINWETLATYGGSLAMVLLFTQLTKDLSFTKKIPTQLWSYVLAFVTLILANVFTTGFSFDVLGQTIFNAAIISAAANGGFSAIQRITGKSMDGQLLIDNTDSNKDVYRLDVGSLDDLGNKKAITLSIKTGQKLSQ